MPDWGLDTEGQRWLQHGMLSNGLDGVRLGFPSAAHVKNTWQHLTILGGTDADPTEVVGGVPFDCQGFVMQFSAFDNNNVCLVDVGQGDGTLTGTVPVVENILLALGQRTIGHNIYFPIPLREGVDMWVRFQSSSTSANAHVRAHINYIGGSWSFPNMGLCRTHGISTAASTTSGTVISPIANGNYGTAQTLNLTRITNLSTPNTASMDAQATTMEDYHHFMIICGNSGTGAVVRELMTLYVNGDPLAAELSATKQSAGYMTQRVYGPWPCQIPAGSTLSMAVRGSTSTNGSLQVAVYGFG